jgi:hypothetical protein
MTKSDVPRIIYVEWVDSARTPGWCEEAAIAHAGNVMPCRTVGFLVKETKEAIAVALNNAHGPRVASPFGEIITIPKVAITKRAYLAGGR